MKIFKFKTNIENEEMVKMVAPLLDKEELISKWSIDIESEDNILSVSGEEITPDIITKPVRNIGYSVELIKVLAIGGHDL
jgi:copper chaperone